MHKRVWRPVLLVPIIPICKDNYVQNPVCSLETIQSEPDYYMKDGDMIIGGILQVSAAGQEVQLPTFTFRKYVSDHCTHLSFGFLRHFLTFMFAIEEINNRSDLLPNTSLGFHIYDACDREYKAIHSVLSILSGPQNLVPNYECHEKSKVVGFIGHKTASLSLVSAGLTGMYHYPQISYGAMDPVFNNKFKFPFFYRTVPDERDQLTATVLILNHFGWSWVGIVSSNDENSQRVVTELKSLLIQNEVCVEFSVTVTNNLATEHNLNTMKTIAQSTCNVILLYNNSHGLAFFYVIENITNVRKTFVFFGTFLLFFPYEYLDNLNGSLLVHLPRGEIPGLKNYLLDVNPERYPGNPMLLLAWRKAFDCLPEVFMNSSEIPYKACGGMESFRSLDPFLYDTENFRFSYSVYSAVNALAHALHEIYLLHKEANDSNTISWQKWQINRFLRSLNITTKGGEEIQIIEGKPAASFDLANTILTPNSSFLIKTVGYFYQDRSKLKLQIDRDTIQWNPKFQQTPISMCSEICFPGYYKLRHRERHSCCHQCVPCPENEITNETDMKQCLKCSENHSSSEKRDNCIQRTIDFLSFEDELGFSLTAVSLFFCFGTVILFGIFLKLRETPIVKANNQTLTLILLLSLVLCFLCPLLFIGRPTEMVCLLQQAVFGITFSVAISSVLAKTVTVVMAFNATKPNRKQRKWLNKYLSISLVILCTFIVVVICVIWVIFFPPYPDFNSQVEAGKTIIQCNEGSATAFYLVIGYMGCLAVLSFVVAFLARKLPDVFNEAQFITFSMLIFCSVWISFIPAYLSTKGKSMVAVEVFAILASSGGLLGCIFIPKCYIILMKPELNVKPKLIQRKAFK